jgi:hypothetical protein
MALAAGDSPDLPVNCASGLIGGEAEGSRTLKLGIWLEPRCPR